MLCQGWDSRQQENDPNAVKQADWCIAGSSIKQMATRMNWQRNKGSGPFYVVSD